MRGPWMSLELEPKEERSSGRVEVSAQGGQSHAFAGVGKGLASLMKDSLARVEPAKCLIDMVLIFLLVKTHLVLGPWTSV